MNIIKQINTGYSSYIEAVSFIIKHSLWRYFLFPLVLFGAVFVFGYYFQNNANIYARELENDALGWFSWFGLNMKYYMNVILEVFFLSFVRYIVFIVLSPVLAIVSEKVEELLTGNKYKFNLRQLIKDVKRGILIAISNMIWEFGLYLIWFVFAKLFGFDEFNLIVSYLLGFYFYGFSFVDYVNERRKLSVSESILFCRKHKWLLISLGSVFSILFIVPSQFFPSTIFEHLGVLIAPIWSCVAATIAMHHTVDLKHKLKLK